MTENRQTRFIRIDLRLSSLLDKQRSPREQRIATWRLISKGFANKRIFDFIESSRFDATNTRWFTIINSGK